MGNEDGKRILDNLFLVIKGEKTMFVDSDLYNELHELKRITMGSLYSVYEELGSTFGREFRHVSDWLKSNDVRTNRQHEKFMIDYLDGALEIKPRPEGKYKVWQLLDKDEDGDEHFLGLINSYGIITITHQITNQLDDDDFDSLTENEINKFQADTGIELPQSMWHEVVEEEETSF